MANTSSAVSWQEASTDATSGKSKNGNLHFVNVASCPLSFVPLEGVISYVQVFDKMLKRSRIPAVGEKGQKRYIFAGADASGKIGAYVAGPQVVEAIAAVLKTASALGKPQVGVLITTTGTGMDTVYSASLDMALTGKIVPGFITGEQPDLEKIKNSLLVGEKNANVSDVKNMNF